MLECWKSETIREPWKEYKQKCEERKRKWEEKQKIEEIA